MKLLPTEITYLYQAKTTQFWTAGEQETVFPLKDMCSLFDLYKIVVWYLFCSTLRKIGAETVESLVSNKSSNPILHQQETHEIFLNVIAKCLKEEKKCTKVSLSCSLTKQNSTQLFPAGDELYTAAASEFPCLYWGVGESGRGGWGSFNSLTMKIGCLPPHSQAL